MRRTRLAAAAGVVALTLGATAAAAEGTANTQEVTITVEAAPRTVTVTGVATFTVNANETNINETDSGSSLTFTNPTGNSPAMIEVVRSGDDLGDLNLKLNVAGTAGTEYATPLEDDNIWTDEGTAAARPPVAEIEAGAAESMRAITWNLSGTAPDTAGDIVSTFTYTITDDE